MERLQLDMKNNPFYQHATAEFFVAYLQNKPVGRIAAIENCAHLVEVAGIAQMQPAHAFHPGNRLDALVVEPALRDIERGQLAVPATVKTYLESDEALQAVGGATYLGRLAEAAVATFYVEEYSKTIYDLSLAEKAQLRNFCEHIDNVADRSEDVADRLAIYAIKRTI